METHEGDEVEGTPPGADEARAALRVAEEARATVGDVRTPLWYFVALGLLVAPIGPAVSLVPDSAAGVLLGIGGVVLWAAALATIMHLVVKQMGVLVWLNERQMRPFAVIMLPLLAAFAAVRAVVEPSWGPEALTVVVGAGIVAFGLYHRFQSQAPS